MKKVSIFLFLLLMVSSCNKPQSPRIEEDFNFDWKFSLKNDVGVAKPDYDDSSWNRVNLPHDWSIEMPFDSIQGHGCTGYAIGGIGHYRKGLDLPNLDNKVAYLHFDGIYNHSEVWINQDKLASHVYGYSPFYVDITNSLNSNDKNTVTIVVDRSRYIDSRWYSGSGIYRNVELVIADKLHVPIWGVFVSTKDVTTEKAEVKIETDIVNAYDEAKTLDLITKILSPEGKQVGKINTDALNFETGKHKVAQSIVIDAPQLWDTENPTLYKAITEVVVDGELVDQYTTTFGIRDIHFDAQKGFFLNGKNMKIHGLCIHADAGSVGVAVPKEVWRRRLQTLKDGGCNALRMAHHPASDELLDLCDEMGFLVQDEFFDEWNYPKDKRLNMNERHDDYISRGYADWFEEDAEKDLKNTMLSHRNHPSIFQWSIGNEIEWTYPRNSQATGFFNNINWNGDYFWSPPPYSKEKIREEYEKLPALEYSIGQTAKQLAAWTREMDTTRPVVANCILPSASFETGYADVLDVVGFSYRRVMYDYARENYPDKTVMGTENLPQWHEWKAVAEREFISGLFLWTGLDYLGEATNSWPRRGLASGLLNIAGFEKSAYHMYKTLWTEDPYLYMCTQRLNHTNYKLDDSGNVVERQSGAWEKNLWNWPQLNQHWNYGDQDQIVVIVMSNTDSVELFLDNKSLGTKNRKDFDDNMCKWVVPYSRGTLTAKSEGQQVNITTSDQAAKMNIQADKEQLKSNGYDLVHLEVMLEDKNGNPVRNDDREILFNVSGDAKIIGIDNGNMSSRHSYKGNRVRTFEGQALLIVQSTKGGKGNITITASAEGMDDVITTCKLTK
ncbi:MAG: glycoside hydrolase family 2 TIM barrel-domain containing protein [Rikenellaceae bacterium]